MAKKKDKVENAEADIVATGSNKLDLKGFRKTLGDLSEKYTGLVVDIGSNQITKGVFLDSPQLTYLFGGKYPTDRIMQLQGPESSGKSTVSNYIAGQLQKKKPEQPVVLYVDFERTFDPIYAGRLGLDTQEGHFVLIHPECGEDGFEAMDALLKTGKLCCIILDSDAAMPTRAMTNDEFGKANFGGGAKLAADALKRINILLNKYDTNLIWISQERASMSMYGSPFSACVTPDTLINIKGTGDIEMGTFIMEVLGLKSEADLEKLAVDYFYDLDKEFLIQSFDHSKKKVVFKRVLSVVRKGEDFVYLVKDSKGQVILECAGAHGIFDAETGTYRPVADISKSVAVGVDGKEEPVTIIRTATKAPIYDLQVEDTECYFSNGILSHNTGGNSIKYFASIRNRITKVDVIKDGKEEVGIQIKVRNLKNKTSVPWREAIMNLYFDGGFDTESEYVDFLTQLEIIQQKGAYFYVPGQEKGLQGKEKLIEWLKENPKQYDEWKQEILEKLSGKLDSDEANTDPDTEKLPTRGTTEADVQTLASQALGVEETPPELGLEED